MTNKDVNSVIHYDMPQSIESYVQEIGRAGRDGNHAECHLIISDQNYYSIRQLLLKNIVDKDICFKFVVKLMKHAKDLIEGNQSTGASSKRKYKEMESDEVKYEVDQETKEIKFNQPKYVFIPWDELWVELDITGEVALTLFSYLEQYYLKTDGEYFIRLFSRIYSQIKLQFYTHQPEDVMQESELVKCIIENGRRRDGTYTCSIPVVCEMLKTSPFEITRKLNELQFKDKCQFQLDKEAFCLHIYKIKDDIPKMAQILYERALAIQENSIRKLNSIYIASRRLSVKSIDFVSVFQKS